MSKPGRKKGKRTIGSGRNAPKKKKVVRRRGQ